MTFTENWYFTEDCEALADLARRTNHLDGAVVEVGCWEGKSTIALATAVHPDVVHAVDTWNGSPGEISEQLAADRDVFATFLANIDQHTPGNVIAHRTGWREFFATWDEQIRLIHIDATHSYDEVRDNIAAARSFMVPGGVICGDDAQHPPVRRAVMNTLGNAFLTGAKLWHWTAS